MARTSISFTRSLLIPKINKAEYWKSIKSSLFAGVAGQQARILKKHKNHWKFGNTRKQQKAPKLPAYKPLPRRAHCYYRNSTIPQKRKKHQIFRPTYPLPPQTRSLLLPKLNKAKLLWITGAIILEDFLLVGWLKVQ